MRATEGEGAFRFVPIGIGDAFSELYYSSSLVLKAEGAELLVDCPHPIRKILREASLASREPLAVERLHAVLLTHLHADHASGVEGLGFYLLHRLGKQIPVAAHEEILRDLWTNHLEGVMAPLCDPVESRRRFETYFSSIPLREETVSMIGPFEIRCRRTIHHVPTTAFLITAGGRTLGYSADTSFDPSLIEWLSQADLIVHESNRGTHTPYENLLALDRNLRDRMRLIHLPDDFNRDESEIEPLVQGQVYRV